MSTHQVNEVKEFLFKEGYRPEIDEDGDLVFKYEGLNCYIHHSDNDNMYYQFVCPMFKPDSVEKFRKAKIVALEVTREIKAAKEVFQGNLILVTLGTFMPSVDAFKSTLDRSLSALRGGCSTVCREISTGNHFCRY